MDGISCSQVANIFGFHLARLRPPKHVISRCNLFFLIENEYEGPAKLKKRKKKINNIIKKNCLSSFLWSSKLEMWLEELRPRGI